MAPPKVKPLSGRVAIPSGYFLGRASGGTGPAELISVAQAKAAGMIPSALRPTGPAGGDLSGTYPNPTVVGLQGRDVASTAPTDAQVLTWDDGLQEWVPADAITYIIGAGVPTSLEDDGVLYSRSDAIALYVSHPTTSGVRNPSVVQSASNSGHSVPGVVTLPGAPTVGNLLIAFLGTDADSHSVLASGWTLITNGGATHFGLAAYRYVQLGDVAALPTLTTSGTRFWFAEAYEITGVTGVWATDFEQKKELYDSTTSPLATTAATTTNPNDLALIGAGRYNSGSNITVSAGWTQDIQANSLANFGAWTGVSRQFAGAAGSSVTATFTFAAGDQEFYIALIFTGNAGSLVAHWDLLAPYTDEQAQDAVGGILTDTPTIDFTYNDGAPSITADVKNNSITFAKMQAITDGVLLGASGGTAVEEITVGTGLLLSANVLSCTITQYTDEMAQDAVGGILVNTATVNFVYDDAANQIRALIPNKGVTYSKIQDVTDNRLLGRSAGSAGAMQEITVGTGLSLAAGALTSTITQYTDEMAQDAVGAALLDTNTIDLTYDDAGNTISADLKWAQVMARISMGF